MWIRESEYESKKTRLFALGYAAHYNETATEKLPAPHFARYFDKWHSEGIVQNVQEYLKLYLWHFYGKKDNDA